MASLTFTITDLGLFLGKSAVTLRNWEKRKLVTFPRDEGGDRKLTSADVREVAQIALRARRITKTRADLVDAAMIALQVIERENA